MARNRMVQKTLFTDYRAIMLTPEVKLFLIGLTTVADDTGDFVLDREELSMSVVVRAGQTCEDVDVWLAELTRVRLLSRPRHGDGCHCIPITEWSKKDGLTFQYIDKTKRQGWRAADTCPAVTQDETEERTSTHATGTDTGNSGRTSAGAVRSGSQPRARKSNVGSDAASTPARKRGGVVVRRRDDDDTERGGAGRRVEQGSRLAVGHSGLHSRREGRIQSDQQHPRVRTSSSRQAEVDESETRGVKRSAYVQKVEAPKRLKPRGVRKTPQMEARLAAIRAEEAAKATERPRKALKRSLPKPTTPKALTKAVRPSQRDWDMDEEVDLIPDRSVDPELMAGLKAKLALLQKNQKRLTKK